MRGRVLKTGTPPGTWSHPSVMGLLLHERRSGSETTALPAHVIIKAYLLYKKCGSMYQCIMERWRKKISIHRHLSLWETIYSHKSKYAYVTCDIVYDCERE